MKQMSKELKTRLLEYVKEVRQDNPDKAAEMEVAIEYASNPDFARKMNEYVFNKTYRKQ